MPKVRTLVIAECGSCHDADLRKALGLVDTAALCGADIAKFQFWSSATRLTARRSGGEALARAYEHYQLPAVWLPVLYSRCVERNIKFMCTAFLPEDVQAVAPYVVHFKVSSFETQAYDLIDAHVPYMTVDTQQDRDRWLIVSRGLGADISCGFRWPDFEKIGGNRIKFLLCTSAYPAPPESLNLRRLHRSSDLDEDLLDGFSDHSDDRSTWSGALAVAAGATIVERHLRLDETRHDNPEWPHALAPLAFREYVRHIRYAEEVLGDGVPHMQTAEIPNLQYLVRS